MPHDVFISHSQHNSDVALQICKVLEEAGIRCWMAPRDVVAGRNWGASIVQAIGASRLFVLVFSAQSNTSPQVLREVERAVSRNVTVLPYRIEQVEPSPELEYYLSVTHWLNAFDADHAKHLTDLVRTARHILAIDEGPPPKVTSPQRANKSDTKLSVSPHEQSTGAATNAHVPITANPLTSVQEPVASVFERVPVSRWKASDVVAHDDVTTVGADVEKSPSASTPDQMWLWIDRLLPAGALVAGLIVTTVAAASADVRISLVAAWQQLSSLVRITGVLCPLIAVCVSAVGYGWSKTRPIIVAMATVSLATPFIGMWDIRQGILSLGSASLSAVAAGLLETLFTVPFVWAAGLALAISIMPRHPRRRYRTTIIALGVLATICVLTNTIAIRDTSVVAAAGGDLRGIAGWLVQIVRP